jgi:hypothetical protein
LSDKAGATWNFHPDNFSILKFIEKDTAPLRSFATIYSGIKTGLKEAYELNEKEHVEILRDPKSKNLVYPLLKPRHIERWSLNWGNTYQIVVQKGQVMDTGSKAYEHLLKFKDRLEKRTDLRQGGAWYSLRDCAYMDLFNAPKIVYRDISTTPKFAVDTKGMVVVDGAFFIPTDDYFLLGLLNSKIGAFYFRSKCAAIGSVGSGGRLRFKKVYVSEFPIPRNIRADTKADIETLARKITSSDTMNTIPLELELNRLVFDLYGVPEEYKEAILEQS